MGCWSSKPASHCNLESAPDDAPRYEQRTGTMPVRIVDVYDGDTFTALIVSDGVVYRRRCRCMGYDSPEMKGKNVDKTKAIAARDYLRDIAPKGVFTLNFNGTDKYGRLLVSFDVGDETITSHMIRLGHGIPYDGGTKKKM